jgi:hypothetical protein
MTNGLGATDIGTRGVTGGIFLEMMHRIRAYYADTYGADSDQLKASSDGHRFEPRVAGIIWGQILREQSDRITIRLRRQFDTDPRNVTLDGANIRAIRVSNRDNGAIETYTGRMFLDATYEGDLAAAAGVPYRLGREGRAEFNEPMAGVIYRKWPHEPPDASSTGLGDNAIQAYNYRLCLTDDPANRVEIPKPPRYNRDEYVSLIDDIRNNVLTGPLEREMEMDGIGRVTNMIRLPNRKTDANHQHLAFLSTDLAEENWPWPTSTWEWRDRYAVRLREYILGVLWFAQNEPELPADFRERCRRWGLARDEYGDNGHFPRQVYVREGRRIEGEYRFTAHDALPIAEGSRPPVDATSITASHYWIDSHACRKREPNTVHLEGIFSYPVRPYTVPYGVIVPKKIDNLFTPVPVSASHCGFGTLRMEPCWIAMGEAAGTAAALCLAHNVAPRDLDIEALQEKLLDGGAVLVYFTDSSPSHPNHRDHQCRALRDPASVQHSWTAM